MDRPPGMPRGIFNNNPGNIRKSPIEWLGLSENQTDPDFLQFDEPVHGIRAIARILKNYQRENVMTVREAISRWAPSVENDTKAYVDAVSKACDVEPDEVVNLTALLPQIVPAIIQHENGVQPYAKETINYGIALA